MIYSVLRLLFISVYAIGSIFSCFTTIYAQVSGGDHLGHHHEHISTTGDSCCPEDGHKEVISEKEMPLGWQKEFPDPNVEKKSRYSLSIYGKHPYPQKDTLYKETHMDRHRSFFRDTIRLIV